MTAMPELVGSLSRGTVAFNYEGMVNLLETLRQREEVDLAAPTTTPAHLPLIRNPTEPVLFAWNSNYIWDPKMRSEGMRSSEWWVAKLGPWLLRDDWKLAFQKQIPGSRIAEVAANWCREVVRWASSLKLETAEAQARSRFGQRLHATILQELRARRVTFPRPFPDLPYPSSAGTTETSTLVRREQRAAALQVFPDFARAVLSRDADDAIVAGKYSKFQSAKFIAAVLHQADDTSVCGYYAMYTTFCKEDLAEMLVRAARLPVRFVWQIAAAKVLTDAQRRRLGAAVEELSAAARRTLLDEDGLSIYSIKTPAARTHDIRLQDWAS
ncbi:hypothetical protein BCV69DRAFT_277416 [Microstroma glucosiphilum]|uniref:Uncharacterized protein n=1 Tax=Pseudomicrostroma glucosiphilum TaxID=1684307 RepID=A0A316U8F0_9BASI|nr:hypothetical protein BCV69DRAFT_277416 [Pseudomicrostroma glucosiphilum]PWN20741.1 hypothetical protein BCV69DRAFT_277416 [Pseudomicrostroma glucosiphilum]